MEEEQKTGLAAVVQRIDNMLQVIESVTFPRSFDVPDEITRAYYNFSAGRLFLSMLETTVAFWKEHTQQFIGEFDGEWRYHAVTMRYEFLADNPDGGSADDYDEDGDPILEDVPDALLERFAIRNMLLMNEPLVLNTHIRDIVPFANLIGMPKAKGLDKFIQYKWQNGERNATDTEVDEAQALLGVEESDTKKLLLQLVAIKDFILAKIVKLPKLAATEKQVREIAELSAAFFNFDGSVLTPNKELTKYITDQFAMVTTNGNNDGEEEKAGEDSTDGEA